MQIINIYRLVQFINILTILLLAFGLGQDCQKNDVFKLGCVIVIILNIKIARIIEKIK